ncbi:MAG: glutamate--tRNA ligase [Hyphomonadaceae bacterium]|jgi:glutamyl-tRNA synthetase|nr:glutamate--tRNA ligase [Hyphomonadaceae bacterium]
MKVRFAPSPTGKLHVGNIRTALMNWLFVRKHGGKFLLRIDDTDHARSTKVFEEGIYADLAWLGLNWDETARQSDRDAIYQAAADRLKADGFLYPCYETSDDLDRKAKIARSRGLPPIYDRAALKLTDAERAAFEAEGRKPHWRFKLTGQRRVWTDLVRGEQPVETGSMSDPVLIRADGSFLYTLPSVVDDVDLGVTHIVRGEDHVTNSGAQIEIFLALGATPPALGHFPLLVGADGEALSKRIGSLSVDMLRDEGIDPRAVNAVLARIGTSDPIEVVQSMDTLIESFDFAKVGRAPARFDVEDVRRVDAQLLHGADYSSVQDKLVALDADLGEDFWLAVRANLASLDDVKAYAQVVRGPVTPVIEDPAFAATAAALVPDGPLTGESWQAFVAAVKDATGAKGKALFMPLRQALTGMGHGPEMGPLFALIGADKARARLKGEAV